MKLEELYQKIGGDLKNVMKRIPNEAMIGKFANTQTIRPITGLQQLWKPKTGKMLLLRRTP